MVRPGGSPRRLTTVDAPAGPISANPVSVGPVGIASADSPPANVPGLHDRPVQATPNELLAEAMELAGQLTASLPESHEAWWSAGRIHYAFNEVPKAQACWGTGAPEGRFRGDARCSGSRLGTRRLRGLGNVFPQAIAADPAVGRGKALLLAEALMNLGKRPRPLRCWKSRARVALAVFCLSLLGQAYLESGRYADAASCFEKVLAAEPNSARDHFALFRCYDKLGDPEAQEHCDRYARLKKQQLTNIAKRASNAARTTGPTSLRSCGTTIRRQAVRLHGKTDAGKAVASRAARSGESGAPPLLAALYWRQGRAIDAMRVSGQSGVGSPSSTAPN
jgi:tetratricopeptide (TPR) repeat protein